MICPNCGTDNAEANRFCLKCGNRLLLGRKPRDPALQTATLGGIVGIVGGGFTILGWLTPWIGLGGILSRILSLVDIGTGFGLLDVGSGVGNGLQLTLLSLVASFAAFSLADTALFGLIGLVVAVILIAIPVNGGLNIGTGINTLEIRGAVDLNANERYAVIRRNLAVLRERSVRVFVILAVIFIVLSAIPFAAAILGSGFYLTALGAVFTYIGTLLVQSGVRHTPTQSR